MCMFDSYLKSGKDVSFLSSQNKVLFVHRGVSFGRFVLFVSDGKHYVSTLLEVNCNMLYFISRKTGTLGGPLYW